MKKGIIIPVIVGVLVLVVIGVIAGVQIRNNIISENSKMGSALLSQGKYEEAIVAFKKVIQMEPSNTKIRLDFSKAYIGAKQFEQAKESLNEAMILDVKNKDIYKKLLESLMVETPKVSQESGKVYEGKTIEVTKGNEEDKIFYTLDGSVPNEKSDLYTEPIKIENGNTTLSIIEVNTLGISSPVVKYEYEVVLKPEERFMILLGEGMVDGSNLSIGDNIKGVIKLLGAPEWKGYFLGGMWYTYKEVAFGTSEGNGNVTAIAFYKGTSVYGIKIGDSIAHVKSVLGDNPEISKTSIEYDEMASEGDQTIMVYKSGKYEMMFHCDSTNTTGAVVSESRGK